MLQVYIKVVFFYKYINWQIEVIVTLPNLIVSPVPPLNLKQRFYLFLVVPVSYNMGWFPTPTTA